MVKYLSIHEYASENSICETAAIMSRGKLVNFSSYPRVFRHQYRKVKMYLFGRNAGTSWSLSRISFPALLTKFTLTAKCVHKSVYYLLSVNYFLNDMSYIAIYVMLQGMLISMFKVRKVAFLWSMNFTQPPLMPPGGSLRHLHDCISRAVGINLYA